MKNTVKISVAFIFAAVFTACNPTLTKSVDPKIKNGLRAPAYPLITIDPYTSIWSFADNLYDEPTKHWTGESMPLVGAIRVDGKVYRFMGTEDLTLTPIANMAETQSWTGRYVFAKPASGWEKTDFNDSRWKEGPAAFGTKEETAVKTLWEGNDTQVWVRREINLENDLSGKKIWLEYSHDDDIEIYINGIEVVNTGYKWKKNERIQLSEEVVKNLKKGKNIIAAHCINRTGGALVDFGLSEEPAGESLLEETAVQQSVDVQPTQTHYVFSCGLVNLRITFTAPLLMDNLNLVSRPINYITYNVSSTNNKEHVVEIYFEVSTKLALDKEKQESQSEILKNGGLVFLKTGSKEQKILGKSGDNVRIDWGYFYLGGEEKNSGFSIGKSQELRAEFKATGDLKESASGKTDAGNLALVRSLGKVNKSVIGKILVGYDDVYSVQYFGENLRPYWNSDGKKDIYQAFKEANADYSGLVARCHQFDDELMTQAMKAGGKEYASLCALAYRQAISAHKLVKAPNGDLVFLSKENFSNGSIGTVDITYPSAPLFLLYNPELAKGLLNHIFYYSESGKWTKPFAAHDIGTYPLGNGQTYGGDMPVEESGNMLILTAAIATMEGNADYAAKHWETLTTWTNYLVEKGLDPENQLCTDDFAGHFAHNTNLSVKAILGIASYGRLAEMLGKQDIANLYTEKARAMAREWMKMADNGDHYRLTFDQEGTWSQKYNLVWDKLMQLNIFPQSVGEKEVKYYLTKQNKYGLPLDNRMAYTKSDWIIWTATLAQDTNDFQTFIKPVYQFMDESTSRVPMTDWYWTDKPEQRGFQARSVVGGYFIKMMENKMKNQVSKTKKFSGNPVFTGWYADPEGTVLDNRFWIYPTYSAPYNEQVFLDAFSSTDLVNWTKHRRILDTTSVTWVKKAIWAPAIVKKDDKYYLFFAGNDIQNDQETGGIGVAVADKPEGPFKDLLGKPLIDKFHNGAQPIDQFVFHDKDGSYYMYYGGWRHCNVAKLKKNFTGFESFPDGSTFKEVTPENYVEGPFMFIKNDKYYFMWSEGGWTGPDYSVAYAIADSPFGPFKRIGKILQQDPNIATGAGHHSVIHVPESDKYYIVYHRRPLTETNGNHREICIDELIFDEKGQIKPVVITKEGVKIR